MKRISIVSLFVLVALVVASCAPAATSTPTSAPTTAPLSPASPTSAPYPAAPTTGATTAPTAGATAAVSPTAAQPTAPATGATPVAQIPASDLVQAGKLLICSDIPYPPQEFFDANGNPEGLDVDIGNEIGARLGLQVVWVNSVFDTIIEAVNGHKCDIIISAMNITSDRQKKVSMIPYFEAGQAFVALKGNPDNITGPQDLCGKSVAAESGTTEVEYLQGTGDYQGKGLTQACTTAGKQPINVLVTQKDTDALQDLQAGKAVVYFTDSPVAAYYTVQHPDQFQLVGQVLQPIQEGIALSCGQADCTNAPLTPVGQAVETALKSMMADGTYQKILDKWNLSSGAVTLP
ncbi:MAG: ABC transporter substrate-binding protein [Chloroflexi bacterium]|nr:ABC transporter substrate-binding protein [Chloroflexota bacterium]